MDIPKEEEREFRKLIELADENISNIIGRQRNRDASKKILDQINFR